MARLAHLVALVLALGLTLDLTLGLSGAAAAQSPRVMQTQATATGPSVAAAVKAAVVEAIRRVNGGAGGGSGLGSPSDQARLDDTIRDIESAIGDDSTDLAVIADRIRTASHGLIPKVSLQITRTTPSETEVVLIASVAIFDRTLATRKTIAVMPFRTSSPTYGFAGLTVAGSEIARRLADEITTSLVQSGVLTVLDRTHVDELAKERSFVESYGRTPQELSRFGKMLGADVMLVGSIESAGLEVSVNTVEASGYTYSRAFAGMQVAARLVEVETGTILWSESVESGLSNGDLSRIFRGAPPDATGTLDTLVKDVAASVATSVVETISPIKVALVEDDTVWLNRGSGRLTPGMRLQVRGGGQDVIDPDTGENLGQSSRIVAVIEVVITDSKKSLCRIVEGRPEDVRAGQVARPLTMP